ncbi:DUF805 domain-containing protein [Massilia arenosa]|uniref:DUF805 domain-containing protein n=1 Tax=Zemynaea arenosa TaxID=2561931 RepID=A0A4Y9SQD1_9BURK|nr:DUF805 domain-containing protein [Massilia arenosa]TFW28748.1 DUF805 domain-containing protein [Massilia arenosa]
MNFTESIQTCFKKYADFSGTASRPEFWWFALFCWLVSFALNVVLSSFFLSMIFSLAILVPSLAAGARRLHDTDRSGWLQLLVFIPVLGWIALLVLLAQEGKANRYSASGQAVPT